MRKYIIVFLMSVRITGKAVSEVGTKKVTTSYLCLGDHAFELPKRQSRLLSWAEIPLAYLYDHVSVNISFSCV